jgi:hypothetical protein
MSQRPDPDADAELASALHRSRVLADAPESLIQRALGLWQPRTPPLQAATPLAGLRRRLSALLDFDSATPTAAGLRSGGDGMRQLLFSAEGRDVDLRISAPGGTRCRLSGQILGPDEAGVALLVCGEFQAETAWNELSEFSFDGVPPGRCSITLRSAEWELVLPDVDVPG